MFKEWFKRIAKNKQKEQTEQTYSALDVALYIINYCNEKIDTDYEYVMSNLKLQKVLYFIQGYFLSTYDKPAFDDKIEAWSSGPVIPKVYRVFQRFGGMHIPRIDKIVYKDKDAPWGVIKKEYEKDIISEEDKQSIREIVELCKGYSNPELVSLTRSQTPCKRVYDPAEPHNNPLISKKAIKEFFALTLFKIIFIGDVNVNDVNQIKTK